MGGPLLLISFDSGLAQGNRAMEINPTDRPEATQPTAAENRQISVWRRMFESLLDPRSIQWILTIGGGLSVLGLIVWLVSLGFFQNPRVLAVALGLGTLALLGAGWLLVLWTRYRRA